MKYITRDLLVSAVGVLLVSLLMAGSIWAWTSAPCGLWKYAKAGETPARCLMVRR